MARKSEHKRQAKLAKQRAKAKESARKQRQLAILQPYGGTKYQSDSYAPIMLTIESAIHSLDQMHKHTITDADVRAGLRCLIGRLKEGNLTFKLGEDDQLVLAGEPRQMIADNICHGLKHHDGRLPTNDHLIGIARTLLGSVDVWGLKNHSPRGYLQFLTGFIGEAASSQVNSGYSAIEIGELFESRGGFLLDDVSANETGAEPSELLELGHDWMGTDDEVSRDAFLQACDEVIAAGNPAEVAATCRQLLSEMPSGRIGLALTAVATAADEGLKLSESTTAQNWLNDINIRLLRG